MKRLTYLFAIIFLTFTQAALAAGPFEHGWQLNRESSAIRFISIKKGSIAGIQPL